MPASTPSSELPLPLLASSPAQPQHQLAPTETTDPLSNTRSHHGSSSSTAANSGAQSDAPSGDAYRTHLQKDSWQPSATDAQAEHAGTATSPQEHSQHHHQHHSQPQHHHHDSEKASSMVHPDSVRRHRGHPAFDLTLQQEEQQQHHHHHHRQQPQQHGVDVRTSPATAATSSDSSSNSNEKTGESRRQRPPPPDAAAEEGSTAAQPRSPPRIRRILAALHLDRPPPQLAWIPSTLTWPKLKPVIRSSIIAWICMVLMLIYDSEVALGTASFLVLISAFIQTAELPYVAVMERELVSLAMVCGAWAYTLIPIAIAHAVRTNKLSPAQANPAAIYQAEYVEASPSVVCAVFLAFGSAFFLYVKVRFGPSPFLFGTIFSCILLNISLTYAPLYPYPVYTFGRSIAVPLAVKWAVTIVVYSVCFPKSVNSQFVDRLVAVLRPLQRAAADQVDLFERSPLDSEFDFELVRTLLNQAEGGLMPLSMSSRLLTREISFGRASGEDLKAFETLTRALITPADGWSFYFSSIRADIETAHFPKTPLPSRLATPAMTPAATPRGSQDTPRMRSSRASLTADAGGGGGGSGAGPDHHGASASAVAAAMRHLDERPSVAPGEEGLSRRFRRMHSGLHVSSRSSSPRRWFQSSDSHHHHHHGSHGSHNGHHNGHHGHGSIFHGLVHRQEAVPVAVWESIRFGNIETHLHTTAANPTTELFAHLILESSRELLQANAEGIGYLVDRLEALNRRRFAMLRDRFTRSRTSLMLEGEKRAQETAATVQRLEAALESFRSDARFRVLDPYREALGDVGADDVLDELDLRAGPGEISRIHHRYLYQAWLHQFHTMSFSTKLLALLRAFERIDRERPSARLWGPSWFRLFHLDSWRDIGSASGDPEMEEEDPEAVPIMEREREQERRAAAGGAGGDSRPARSASSLAAATGTHTGAEQAATGSAFDLGHTRRRDPDALDPEGTLQILGQRLYFGVARLFQGHLLFGVKAAVLIALVSLPAYMRSSAAWVYRNRGLWTIFMAQLTLARFRGETAFALLSRLVATFVGACFGLVIWYVSAGSGRGNAFGLGATTAVAFPLLMLFRLYYPGPPITTIITCVTAMLIVGYSWQDVTNPSPGSPGFGWTVAWKRFVTVAIGVTAALDMAAVNVSYEYSLRGRWPKQRYAELFKVQMELLKLLSHTLTVISQLGPAYSLALLRRTRFLDPLFLGDVISVISMCSTALKTSSPLPQITPCPLLDRFLLFEHGFDVRYHRGGGEEQDDAAGGEGKAEEEGLLGTLPRKISLKTLREHEYMSFAVGVVTLFGLVVRIDRLCVAVKELVGESFEVPADVHRTMVAETDRNGTERTASAHGIARVDASTC
ncbi:uncharacterized protein PFL1_06939 [Pseudozyma flocculosa PF-1]|uniref:ER transporter 6TM N-terminal domain-containing protein n=1 Tax=Pseudozyma flocculosa PF-1 TaxID=1277687 RepID=A0A061H681_9BASI|nr:uncharacterized protein PFL1_06939 [Pseudozyma flocculosa PF-1]EPQ28128.1 hypothetical protein PFL1_06939 [Pseudozyma flocculosa PF-1]